MALAPGDVVTLKSGGHSMTVISVGDEDIDCLWIGDDGELFRQSIPAVALTVIELTDSDEEDEEEKRELRKKRKKTKTRKTRTKKTRNDDLRS